MRRGPLNIVDCGLVIGAVQGEGRKLETCAVQGASRKLVLLKALRRKLEIDNAEGVHINFRHFRHFSSL